MLDPFVQEVLDNANRLAPALRPVASTEIAVAALRSAVDEFQRDTAGEPSNKCKVRNHLGAIATLAILAARELGVVTESDAIDKSIPF